MNKTAQTSYSNLWFRGDAHRAIILWLEVEILNELGVPTVNRTAGREGAHVIEGFCINDSVTVKFWDIGVCRLSFK